MKLKNKTFLMFADCILVKGHLRSIIYDLSRVDYLFIDNRLADFIQENEGLLDLGEVVDLKERFGEDLLDAFYELINLEYIFICNLDEVLRFPKLNKGWGYPSHILNAIVQFKKDNLQIVKRTIEELSPLGCTQYQLIAEETLTEKDLRHVLAFFEDSAVEGIELNIPYSENYELLIEELKDKPRIVHMILYNAPENRIIENESGKEIAYLLDQELAYRGFVDFDYFTIGILYFAEAKHHHTYFNRKIFINSEGTIYRYFGDKESFGNITDISVSLSDLVQQPLFQKYWNAKKDKTQICCECEFRYMCFDPRVPFQKQDGQWAHAKSCNYNPYQALWAGEADYQDTNEFYEKEFQVALNQ